MWNPPALTATEEGQHEDSVTTQPLGANDGGPSRFGADTMFSFPPLTLSGDHHELENQNDRGFLDLNCSTGFLTGANSTNVKNITSQFKRESDFSIPSGNDNVTSDCSMNFMLPWSPGAGYPIKAHGAEAKTSRISSRMGNVSVTGNTNDNNNTDINVFPRTYSSPRDVNGDFLSLGIGGGTEIKSNSNFSTREIASKLGDPVSASSQHKSSMVGQSPWFLDPMGFASAVRTNGGGFSRPTLTGSSRLNPIQFPCVETQQAYPQYDNFLMDPTQPSSTSPSGIPIISQRGCAAQTPTGPQIARPTSLRSQFVPRQQQYGRRSYANTSSEFSRNNLSDSLRGSSISHAQLGTLTPLTEARQGVAGGRFPGGVRYRGSVQPLGNFTSQVASTNTGVANTCPSPASFQPVGTSCNLGPVAVPGNSLFPRSFGIPIPRAGTIQSGAAGPFPRRLGVQPNDPTVRSIRGSPAIRLPAQYPAQYPVGPLLPSGPHHHGMPAQLPTDFPRADYFSGVHIPAQAYPIRPLVSSGQFGVRPPGTFVPHPHLKRQATENPSTGLVSQRRKISHQPVVIRRPVPVQTHHHIKCQMDIEEPLEPSGYKCLLCKRDVSFTAEGRVLKPAIPPAVAVLACGHTFHEDCLQRITPEDYSIDPPCIPCALGET